MNNLELNERFDRLERSQDKIIDGQIELKVDIAKLKVKSGIWGMIGGALPVICGLLIYLFQGKIK